MTSLRKHLLVWLLPVFLAAAIIATVWTYYMFGNMVSMFMDGQMSVLADSHAAETFGPPTLRPLTDHHVEKGALIVQIWDGQGSLLTSSYPAVAAPWVRFGVRRSASLSFSPRVHYLRQLLRTEVDFSPRCVRTGLRWARHLLFGACSLRWSRRFCSRSQSFAVIVPPS